MQSIQLLPFAIKDIISQKESIVNLFSEINFKNKKNDFGDSNSISFSIVNKGNGDIILQEETYCAEDIKNVSQETEGREDGKNVGVYITTYGEKYHREYCGYLRRTKDEMELEKAIKAGYEPCAVCKP